MIIIIIPELQPPPVIQGRFSRQKMAVKGQRLNLFEQF